MIIWLTSVVADVWVLGYHIAERPHPKFLLPTPRLVSINAHAFSGASECITGMYLFVFQRGAAGRKVTMTILLCFSMIHMVTALYQCQIVFGVRKVMVPASVWLASWRANLRSISSHIHACVV